MMLSHIRTTTPNSSPAAQRVLGAFAEALAALAPLAPGRRLLLGCSAGGDSMALLELMAGAAAERRWALAVAHLDHAQRPESAAEAGFVAERAAALGLPCFSERLALDPSSAAGPLTEDVMRQARHAAFRRFAADWGADAIALAHQADDQAETFLIRLLAGSGPTGLGAIRPVEVIEGLTLVRPLLGARRADLRAWLRGRGLDWRDDPTNDDLAAKRSWVRGALLPLVRQKIGLDPTDRITRAAALIREESEILGETIGLFLGQLALPAPPPALARLDLTNPLWRGTGPLVRRQLLRQWLWELRRGPHPPGYEAVDEALAFVQANRPGAQLRTVERLHVVHCKTSLLAFAPEVDRETRTVAALPFIPPKPPRKKA
jgi:tRNA(Ile)-lysidine synthase